MTTRPLSGVKHKPTQTKQRDRIFSMSALLTPCQRLEEQLLMQDKAPHPYQNLTNPDPSELHVDLAQRYIKVIQ